MSEARAARNANTARDANVARVAGVDVDTRHWIGGRRVGSAGTFTDVSPLDEQPLAQVASGGQAEVDAAIEAARAAFRDWARCCDRTGAA